MFQKKVYNQNSATHDAYVGAKMDTKAQGLRPKLWKEAHYN